MGEAMRSWDWGNEVAVDAAEVVEAVAAAAGLSC